MEAAAAAEGELFLFCTALPRQKMAQKYCVFSPVPLTHSHTHTHTLMHTLSLSLWTSTTTIDTHTCFLDSTDNSKHFEHFFRAQGVLYDEEWGQFMRTLRRPLPLSFRLNRNCADPFALSQCIGESVKCCRTSCPCCSGCFLLLCDENAVIAFCFFSLSAPVPVLHACVAQTERGSLGWIFENHRVKAQIHSQSGKANSTARSEGDFLMSRLHAMQLRQFPCSTLSGRMHFSLVSTVLLAPCFFFSSSSIASHKHPSTTEAPPLFHTVQLACARTRARARVCVCASCFDCDLPTTTEGTERDILQQEDMAGFAQWLADFTSLGVISRQEIVSMVPVAFLNIQVAHKFWAVCMRVFWLLFPSDTHTHARTHTHTLSHSLTHTHTHTLSLSLSLSLSLAAPSPSA